jgi:hypothetical protein
MTQFLRPNANLASTSWTGGFADIDEVTPNDNDYCYGAENNSSAQLRVSLSSVPQPDSGTVTVRWRYAKVTSAGVVDGGGNSLNQTCTFRQGSTTLASATVSPGGTWGQQSFTVNADDITDWTNLQLLWTQTASGGGPAARRGSAVSWAEVEAPGIPVTRYILIT